MTLLPLTVLVTYDGHIGRTIETETVDHQPKADEPSVTLELTGKEGHP